MKAVLLAAKGQYLVTKLEMNHGRFGQLVWKTRPWKLCNSCLITTRPKREELHGYCY